MKLIIAEKPDQARTLASIFQTKTRKGYIEILPNDLFPNGAYMTWAIGHLAELAPPEKYNPAWKQWTLSALPILPDKFQLEVMKDKREQFQVIQKLVNDPKVTEIIHAGDAGREGELIIRNILRLTKAKQPMKRLWISSLTPNAIKNGFRNLLNEPETRNLFYEAYTRACADWIVGINASRLYTLLLRNHGFSDVFSVGRVQTPTLALIVKREYEIERFQPEPFWEVFADFSINGKSYRGKWFLEGGDSRIKEKQMAEKIAQFCLNKPAEIAAVKTEKKEYNPPLLYNLSALQADANRRYKFSPKKTLDVLQSLYQKGIISYPRSDSRYITDGEAETLPEILQKLAKIPDFSQYFPLPVQTLKGNRRYVNEKKVTDHYAIIPTEQVPKLESLSGDERKLYAMIVNSVIAAHYPKAVYEYTTITTKVADRALFISRGKVQLEEGFRKVLPEKSEKDMILPKLEQGEQGVVVKTETKESQTQPPKRYTEGQLITLMKTAGKFVEDKELEKVLMETEGLGTEATRANIITMLKQRKYIEVKKNLVYATAKAKIIIQTIGEELLASPEMTAKWEKRLKEISEGKAVPKQFMEQTNRMIQHLVEKTKKNAANWSFNEELKENFVPGQMKKKSVRTLGSCKICDGKVVDKGSFYGCTHYQKNGCTFTISKTILGKKIAQTQIRKLLKEGQTDSIDGFKSKEKTFRAKLAWNDREKKITFLFQ